MRDETTYLALWFEGTLSDRELEKREGKESLNRYRKIKEVSSTLVVEVPENLKWEVFSKQLPQKRKPQKKTRSWAYAIAASFIVLVGIQTDLFRIGYNYDVTTSQLTTASGGSHELSFGLNFTCKPPKKKYRTISCPSF